MVPSDSMEDSVQKTRRCPWIQPQNLKNIAAELQKKVASFCLETLEFFGPNCNENDVYNVLFKVRIVPSDSVEDCDYKTWEDVHGFSLKT